MKTQSSAAGPAYWLGIEGGGTRTVALRVSQDGHLLQRIEAGPGNLRLLSPVQLRHLLRALARPAPQPISLAIGLAGARTEADRQQIRDAAAKIWPGTPCYATNDLETALAADLGDTNHAPAHVLVLSGTGSCCYGRTPSGETAKVGGWGHLLGDRGSGYHLGLLALRGALERFDATGQWPALGGRLLAALQLNDPEELVAWIQSAGKADIAALAPEVFAAAGHGDALARSMVDTAAQTLTQDAVSCARRLTRLDGGVRFVLAGSVLLKQPGFARQVARHLQRLCPGSETGLLTRESAWGAVELARRFAAPLPAPAPAPVVVAVQPRAATIRSPRSPVGELSPTEQRNPRSMNLDRLPLAEAIELMLSEDEGIPAAIRAERAKIERAIRWIIRAFRCGGRLFYVGAGTSGRMGVLDASECPPTFRTPPHQVQGLIAGGRDALWTSVEGAEDDHDAGARALTYRGVTSRDVVVGIAASGRTPFVWGALRAARKHGASTILLTFNPLLRIDRSDRPSLVIAPATGPEVLTGSTRLKAGTATKLVLNMFTTLSMARLGKVVSNLMVDVHPANSKLRDRAARILQQLAGVDAETAWRTLEQTGWVIKTAWNYLRRSQSSRAARSRGKGASASGPDHGLVK